MIETVFAPWHGAAVGVFIGLSAVLLMASAGRIAGISGIFRGLLTMNFGEEARWRGIFILGLLMGAAWTGLFFTDSRTLDFQGGTGLTVLAGLLVGLGVTWGAGCTSGHGICGIARLSNRSMIATCIFVLVAAVTVFVTRHIVGV
jgi:uncharacterized protein